MTKRFRWFLVAFLAALAPLLGQPVPNPLDQPAGQMIRVSEDFVLIDAVVTDSSGAPVTDLTAEEFELTDGGRRQEITELRYVSTGSRPTASLPIAPEGHPGARPFTDASQVRRSIVLIADTSAEPHLLPRVQEMLRDFADRQMQRGDLVSIRTLSEQEGILGQFTSDRRRLHAAIDEMAWTPVVGPINEIVHYQAVNSALAALSEVPGRKVLVYITPGFVWFPRDVRDDDRSRIVEQMFNQVSDLAQRTGVVFYSMDPLGPTSLTRGTSSGSPVGSGMGLPRFSSAYDQAVRSIRPRDAPERVARGTGGFLLHGNSDLRGLLERILDDLNGYYLIGYRPPHEFGTTEEPAFHKIQVKVTRRRVSVRSRAGYYGVADTPALDPEPGQERLRAALFSPLPAEGIHIEMSPFYSAGERDASTGTRPAVLRTLFAVDPASLPLTEQPDGAHTATLNLAAVAYAADGSVAARDGAVYTLNMPPEQLSDGEGRSLAYQLDMTIQKPGPYVLRTAVTDELMENVGSAQAFVEIPDFDGSKLALSTLVVVYAEQEPLPTLQGDLLPPGNSIQRVFQAGSSVRYLCAAIGASVDPTTGRPNLETEIRLYRGSRRMLASTPVAAAADDSAEEIVLAGTMTLPEELPVGEYVMELVAYDRLADTGQTPASQWATFTLTR